ncbi:surface antigen-domain-containing protein [Limtongia smithiae]|uniref:surface antigen-domain-containing protein n=1 Tax=Limtongia smithiae TaxID=1125753 RepID=UPI0034CF8A10
MADSADALRARTALYDALARNTTLPVRLDTVTVQGAPKRTRETFLRAQTGELRAKSEYTLAGLLSALDETAATVSSFGVFSDVEVALQPGRSAPGSDGAVPLDATIIVKAAPSTKIRTGTDVGNGDVTAYVQGSLSNVFGGAETLSVDAKVGAHKQSSYLATFTTPINNASTWRAEASALVVSAEREWAAHSRTLRGVTAKVTGPAPWPLKGATQELGYDAFWRTIGALQKGSASETVRAEAGESFKSSIFHSYDYDTRNDVLFPTSGVHLKARAELAGFVPAAYAPADTDFVKAEVETTAVRSAFGEKVTVSLGSRCGWLYSLTPGGKSNIQDRFFLGGANSVRGFYNNRLGPADEADSVGGDAFLAAGASIFTKLPHVHPDSPLRLHLFANAGSLLALDRADPRATLKSLLTQPSAAAGVGLVYRHPVARFELNFTLPLAALCGCNGACVIGWQAGVVVRGGKAAASGEKIHLHQLHPRPHSTMASVALSRTTVRTLGLRRLASTAAAAATQAKSPSPSPSRSKSQLPSPKVKVMLDASYDPYAEQKEKFASASTNASLAELSGAASWRARVVLKFMQVFRMDIEENQAAPVAGGIYVRLCGQQGLHAPGTEEYSATARFYYQDMELTPSLSQWFQITTLHIWMLLARMRALPQKYAVIYEQALVDGLFLELERRLAQDYKVKSGRIIDNTMKELNLQLRGSILAYDEALTIDTAKGDAVLATAIWRNVFGGRKNIDVAHLATMVRHVRTHLYVLNKLSDFDFAVGRFAFLPPWLEHNPDTVLRYQPPPLPSKYIFPGYESKFSRDN